MNNELLVLSITAASTGFIHTLAGPDHYLPFIVLAKARKWTFIRTAWITFLCGLGHVGTSVIIGLVGVALSVAELQYLREGKLKKSPVKICNCYFC